MQTNEIALSYYGVLCILWTPKSDGEHQQRQQTNSERNKNCSYLKIKYIYVESSSGRSNKTFRKCLHCIPVYVYKI